MKEIKYVITDPLGMHARPAGMLVKAVAPYASKITVTAPTGTADAKRLMALMAHIAKSANEAGIWAGICGELGADPKMQEKFIEMGYTELSMAPGRILETRKLVCESEI